MQTRNEQGFVLTEKDDPSEYMSVQMFNDNAMNPCMPSTYSFIAKVVEELVELHKDVNPLTTFHFGGDEVASAAWLHSTSCRRLIERRSDVTDVAELKRYFAGKVKTIASKHGLDLAGWEDGLSDKNEPDATLSSEHNRTVYSYIWNNIWEWGRANRAYKFANSGYKVVMAQATHLYFDHPQEPDPEERGYYWATRYTDTEKVFGFSPYNLYTLADTTREGHPLTREMLCGPTGKDCTSLTQPQNIAGIQGHLWTETVRTPAHMDAMIFPRLLALAERAWHHAEWEDMKNASRRDSERRADWSRFAAIVGRKEFPRLDKLGVGYYLPRPGARIVNGWLEANTQFPGQFIEYSGDSGQTWFNYTNPLQKPYHSTVLRTRTASTGRFSRPITLSTTPTSTSASIFKFSCAPIIASLLAALLIKNAEF